MTKQTINIGRSANDKTGDPIRVAFRKVNENFTELYNAVGADVQIPSQTGNANKYLKTNGTTLSWATVAGGDANLGDITVENANTLTIENTTLGLRSFNTGGLAYDCVFPLMFTSIDYVPGGDIWKRTAHGTSTW